MKRISTSQKYLILREIYRHYLDYSDHYQKTGHDIIVGGTHDEDCEWWQRLTRTNKQVDPEKRVPDAPCTCGFSQTGPVTISFLDLRDSLKNLSKRKKEAVWYNVIMSYKQWQVAEIMDIKMVTVGQYVKSAMIKIANEYWPEDTNINVPNGDLIDDETDLED